MLATDLWDRLLDKYIAAKVLSDRISWYINKVSTLMVVFLFFDRVGWSWWLLLFIPPLVAVIQLERKKFIQGEQAYYLRHNPALQDFMRGLQSPASETHTPTNERDDERT